MIIAKNSRSTTCLFDTLSQFFFKGVHLKNKQVWDKPQNAVYGIMVKAGCTVHCHNYMVSLPVKVALGNVNKQLC